MSIRSIESQVGPCSSPSAIRGRIDELLELRFASARIPHLVTEIDGQLRLALSWLTAVEAGVKCA